MPLVEEEQLSTPDDFSDGSEPGPAPEAAPTAARMITRPSHALAFLLGFWLALWIFLPLAAPPAFSDDAPAARAPAPDPELARLEAELFEARERTSAASTT